MATRVELSVGGTTGVPSLADQIKRFQPRVFGQAEGNLRAFDRAAKVRVFAFDINRTAQRRAYDCRTWIRGDVLRLLPKEVNKKSPRVPDFVQ